MNNILSLPQGVIYEMFLHKTKSAYIKIRKYVYALLDHNEEGRLLKKYVIVERLLQENQMLHVCTCDLDDCLHIKQVEKLWPTFILEEDEEEFNIIQLDQSLYGVYCAENRTYSIIKKLQKSNRCLVCEKSPEKCVHANYFKSNCHTQDIPITQPQPVEFPSISKQKIPIPLDSAPNIVHYQSEDLRNYCLGIYPQHLVPPFNPNLKCEHGFLYSQADPILSGYLTKAKATIHMSHIDLECSIYYRPSDGDCQCVQQYDGRSHLLLNLDNSNLYSYIWLLEILNNTQETRYPLACAFRSANRTRSILGQLCMKEYMRSKLREAYNSFIRLLHMDFEYMYECEVCGPEVETIVCDGIMSGCQKEQMPSFKIPAAPALEIPDCELANRVFINKATTRKQLEKYAGLNRGRYKDIPEEIPDNEFQLLCQNLSSNPPLQNAVTSAGNPCPLSLQLIFGELSRCSPTVGLFQIAGKRYESVRSILQEISNGDFSKLEIELPVLKKSCPLLIKFLSSQDIQKPLISSLLHSVLLAIEAPFVGKEMPGRYFYGPSSEAHETLGYFPNYPVRHRNAKYAANNNHRDTLAPECRKYSQRHPTLTPGMLTLFCPHGICLGFQIMETPESPKTVFDILMVRFKRMPKLIIYDNSCHLHTYALKREPVRFQDTRFMVDRLHFKRGHIGCSLGYGMNTYSTDPSIASINSQVNEQANRFIHNLSTQMSFMGPENAIQHLKIFFALRNAQKSVYF